MARRPGRRGRDGARRRRAADAAGTELHSPGLRSPEPRSPALRSPALRSPGARLRSLGARSSMERALPARAISNKNVEWLSAPGAWTFVVALIVLAWLLFSLVADAVRPARGAPRSRQACWKERVAAACLCGAGRTADL